ncbi:winged helix-turn-helix transcriptional regulator [Amycolatopsis sp. H20-H5]|uniref:winged helix-turn-helix transcriptional regulator n=1 Tax=Amycolatopsis sp. H20-H5 TaxID=3046309 RepID=UPI002DBACB9F|nr:helix-turn-helix domain-containing protein [Amycolatopsis sp. H20-H5]MEC3981514.1 helix-turn-helix domain-containing protein [Amycolatopsis sp. H20-H5]
METICDVHEEPWDVYLRNCPCREVLDLVANKWTALMLGALARKAHRFGELRRAVDGISQKMLTQNLRSLERDGLVTRTVYPTTPPTVEYALTGMGAEVGAYLIALSAWSEANFTRIREARANYDHRVLEPVS